MDHSTNKISRLRRSHKQIEELLEGFEKGNSNIAEFCELHSISKATFHKWKSRYRTKTQKNAKGIGFARLKIPMRALDTPSGLFAEVNGIKVYQPVAATYLKELACL